MMKTILLVLAVTCAALMAPAQSVGVYGLALGTNTTVASTATNTPDAAFVVSEFDAVGVQVSAQADAASTGNVVFRFASSLTTDRYEMTPGRSLTLALDGTNIQTAIEDFSVPNEAALKLTAIENTNAVAVTNISARVRYKATKEAAFQSSR